MIEYIAQLEPAAALCGLSSPIMSDVTLWRFTLTVTYLIAMSCFFSVWYCRIFLLIVKCFQCSIFILIIFACSNWLALQDSLGAPTSWVQCVNAPRENASRSTQKNLDLKYQFNLATQSDLSYDIKIWTHHSFVLSQITRLTDEQTEFSSLDGRPRLRSM